MHLSLAAIIATLTSSADPEPRSSEVLLPSQGSFHLEQYQVVLGEELHPAYGQDLLSLDGAAQQLGVDRPPSADKTDLGLETRADCLGGLLDGLSCDTWFCIPDNAVCCESGDGSYCRNPMQCVDGGKCQCPDGGSVCGNGCIESGAECCDNDKGLYCHPDKSCVEGGCGVPAPPPDPEPTTEQPPPPSDPEPTTEQPPPPTETTENPPPQTTEDPPPPPPETTSEEPITTELPTTSEEPTTTEVHMTTEEPTTSDEPTTTEEPSTAEETTTLEESTSAEEPSTTDDSPDPTIPNLPIPTDQITDILKDQVPTAAQDDPASACFLATRFTSYYTTPDWYKSLPAEAQSYYSSVNHAASNTASCTKPVDSDSGSSNMSPGEIAGAAVGGVAGAAILAGLIVWGVKAGLFTGMGGAGGAAGMGGAEASMAPSGEGWNGVSGGINAAPPPAAPPPAHPPVEPVLFGGYRQKSDEEDQRQYQPYRAPPVSSPTNSSVGSFIPRRPVPTVSPGSVMGSYGSYGVSEAHGQQISEVHGNEVHHQLDGNTIHEAPSGHGGYYGNYPHGS